MKHLRWLETIKITKKQKQESKSNAFLRSNNSVHDSTFNSWEELLFGVSQAMTYPGVFLSIMLTTQKVATC